MSIKMKIAKSKVTASTADNKPNPHKEAIDYIQSAIQALSTEAQNGDSLAKESIANLSVVLLDLK